MRLRRPSSRHEGAVSPPVARRAAHRKPRSPARTGASRTRRAPQARDGHLGTQPHGTTGRIRGRPALVPAVSGVGTASATGGPSGRRWGVPLHRLSDSRVDGRLARSIEGGERVVVAPPSPSAGSLRCAGRSHRQLAAPETGLRPATTASRVWPWSRGLGPDVRVGASRLTGASSLRLLRVDEAPAGVLAASGATPGRATVRPFDAPGSGDRALPSGGGITRVAIVQHALYILPL